MKFLCGKTMNNFLLGQIPILVWVFLLLFWGCSFSPPLDLGPPPRQKKIYWLEWSPDGKKIAFLYQNNSPSNLFFHVYSVNIDGEELKNVFDINSQKSAYGLYKWLSNDKILSGDAFNLDELSLSGTSQRLLTVDANSSVSKEINFVCPLPNSNLILINNNNVFPMWVDIFDVENKNKKSLTLEDPTSAKLLLNKSTSAFDCSPYSNNVFFEAQSYDKESKTGSTLFAIGEVDLARLVVRDVKLFNPFSMVLSLYDKTPLLKILGWGSKDSIIYAFLESENSTSPLIVYEYNFRLKQTNVRKDINVLGHFSPNFKKVAYVNEINGYIVVSNIDGTDKKNLVSITSLPLGDLPL